MAKKIFGSAPNTNALILVQQIRKLCNDTAKSGSNTAVALNSCH